MRLSLTGRSISGVAPHPRASPLISRFRLNALYGEKPETPSNTYLALGLAHCFEKQEDGKLQEKYVIEPIAAASLECMATGAKTSFKYVTGTTLGTALQRDRSALPEVFGEGLYCEDFAYRCNASARTWTRPHAQDNLMDIVPFEQIKANFNYKTDQKRVLNFDNIVTDDDNVKQDMSIDVYGRAEKAEEEKKEETGAEEKEIEEEEEEEKEDDLESFLAA